MGDDTVRLSTIGRILRNRWRVLVALAVLGALVGAGASMLFSPGYRTTTSVLLQGSRDESELLTEAQVASSSVVLDRAAQALGWGVSGEELRGTVKAGANQANIVQIAATANTPEKAQALADEVAAAYVAYTAQLFGGTADAASQVAQEQANALRRQVQETNDRITDLAGSVRTLSVESVDVRTQLEQLRNDLADAMLKLDQTDETISQTKTIVMGPAQRPVSPAAPTMAQFVGGGALAFFLLGVLGHLIGARADRRLRDESEIGAAVGGPVLGSVDVPVERGGHLPSGAPRHRWSRWLGTDRPWNEPDLLPSVDQASREIRYRRALSRLHDEPLVVLVVADDDPAGRAAATQLAAAASGPELRIVVTSARRPTVPTVDDASGAVVVQGTGTRTGWELVALATACTDAGLRVLGTVVAHPVRASRRPVDELIENDALAGSA
ncbi:MULTISPECIES: exopolysaccharide biosynthesis protein [Amycolatopsis]|uniref:Polysaccharide biosynthesis protein n=1 Tax=Amycolatopsis thermalba TaxID=944492 RepID=A0ABY4NNS9_9PSEU|nr:MULTISPECIES: exopolysaccharide biosynthesis protein [Amycolatopsis]OXM74142.1 exopolysaccharide biosynthesis protein [Amycolatopsis sp. KNN50.9b]UQS22278.1 polysaccharide biosynthesis protein [Amycolatopsis thermalba]